jgi:DnaJ-class molecular chaperone
VTGPHGDTNLLEHLLAQADPFRECPTCEGEGYLYEECAGRQTTHPVIEWTCLTCNGSGEQR